MFYVCNGIRILGNFVENQAGADSQTAKNTVPKHVDALLQVKEEGLHQIFDGGRTEVS